MKTRQTLILILFLTTSFMCLGQSISVDIREKQSDEAIPFLQVQLFNDGHLISNGTTDLDGKVIFKNLKQGDYKIFSSYIGCTSDTTSIGLKLYSDLIITISLDCHFIKCQEIGPDLNEVNFTKNQPAVSDFIKLLKFDSTVSTVANYTFTNNILTIKGHANKDWVTLNDISFLMTLIKSEVKSKCVWTDLASVRKVYSNSTIGGQAMNIIDSYRLNKPYPYFLNDCSTTSEQRVKEIEKWWTKNKE